MIGARKDRPGEQSEAVEKSFSGDEMILAPADLAVQLAALTGLSKHGMEAIRTLMPELLRLPDLSAPLPTPADTDEADR